MSDHPEKDNGDPMASGGDPVASSRGIIACSPRGVPLPNECPKHSWKAMSPGNLLCPGCRKEIEEALKSVGMISQETVNHPAHYGGADNPYEAIKVIEAWGLGFCLGNTVKYICRAGKKSAVLEDLRKARFYLDREIARLGALDAEAKLK